MWGKSQNVNNLFKISSCFKFLCVIWRFNVTPNKLEALYSGFFIATVFGVTSILEFWSKIEIHQARVDHLGIFKTSPIDSALSVGRGYVISWAAEAEELLLCASIPRLLASLSLEHSVSCPTNKTLLIIKFVKTSPGRKNVLCTLYK